MKPAALKKITQSITDIRCRRYKGMFKKNMPAARKNDLIISLEEAYVRDRLIVEFLPNGKLAYFAHFLCSFMGEFDELVLHISALYCVEDKKIRARFYKAIHKKALEMKTLQPVKRILVDVNHDDDNSKKHFNKIGHLTYVELVGKTSEGLKNLSQIEFKKSDFKIGNLEARDINRLIDLDLASHLSDKTSRMRGPFMRPNAKEKMMKPFYNALLKKGICFVAKSGKHPVGDIGLFIDKENKWGLIACIFVANDFKNKGISKLLYKKALLEFKKKKCDYYIGATTTTGVLAAAKTIGRIESKSCYLVKI